MEHFIILYIENWYTQYIAKKNLLIASEPIFVRDETNQKDLENWNPEIVSSLCCYSGWPGVARAKHTVTQIWWMPLSHVAGHTLKVRVLSWVLAFWSFVIFRVLSSKTASTVKKMMLVIHTIYLGPIINLKLLK